MRRFAVAIVVLLVACTSEPPPPSPSETPSETPSGDPVEVDGPTSAAEAMRRLCVAPDVEVDPVKVVPTPRRSRRLPMRWSRCAGWSSTGR